jgi:NAD(P)-dependent dehydrogenase (short-subunit alcohol dehydrogenase family)
MKEPSPKPTGRVAVVTGASSGIGRATARDLAARGDTVVLVSRAEGRGADVVEGIRAETGGDVHFVGADLGLFAGQRAFVAAFRARWSRLDVLVLNAGAYFGARERTADGVEATWALNHLGVFVPAVLLADLLVASAPARVVITSSDAAQMARFRWDDLEFARGYSGWVAYAQSKLANQVAARALARRLEGTGVSVHAFHPGFVATGFGAGEGLASRAIGLLQRVIARTPERGADTMTWLATGDVPGTGGYWMDRRPRRPARGGVGVDVEERLWAASVARAGLTDADVAAFERAGAAA